MQINTTLVNKVCGRSGGDEGGAGSSSYFHSFYLLPSLSTLLIMFTQRCTQNTGIGSVGENTGRGGIVYGCVIKPRS